MEIVAAVAITCLVICLSLSFFEWLDDRKKKT